MVEGLCHIMPVMGLKRPNTGKDDDEKIILFKYL
jgi:hypothetical protein